jgi:hypothetical protein
MYGGWGVAVHHIGQSYLVKQSKIGGSVEA